MPGPGLAGGVLHEITAGHADRPAAFGFLLALTAAALGARPGPAVFIAARRAVADFGLPYGHGLAQMGLDPGRLILVETGKDKDALWALEEALRSPAQPAIVAGALGGGLDLTPSRRLNLAAALHATPLVILRGARATGTSAAATRWRIASAPAARDRFGTFAASAMERGAGALPQSAVRASGSSSGIMSRIVSVWLKAWPIARLLRTQGLRLAG